MTKRNRILIRGVNWLGDSIMTMPAVARLREARPDDHIAILMPEKLADLWKHDPNVDSVLTVGADESILAVSRRLRREAFAEALILPNSTRAALEAWLARIPRRFGSAGKQRAWLLTDIIPRRATHHEIQKRGLSEIRALGAGMMAGPARSFAAEAHQQYNYLHMVAHLGAEPRPCAPVIPIRPAEVRAVAETFQIDFEACSRPVFGLNPGAEYGPAKRWEPERFIEAARAITESTGCRWILFGGKSDVQTAARIEAALYDGSHENPAGRCVWNLAGRTSLRELCVALSACTLVLTNDTGPMHLAAAVGTPVVVPFGSTSPHLTGPGAPGDRTHRLIQAQVPCSPCFQRECPLEMQCMRSISVEAVVDAVLDTARIARFAGRAYVAETRR